MSSINNGENEGAGAVSMEKENKPMDQGAHIILKLKGQDGNEVFCKIKRNTQLRKSMIVSCDR